MPFLVLSHFIFLICCTCQHSHIVSPQKHRLCINILLKLSILSSTPLFPCQKWPLSSTSFSSTTTTSSSTIFFSSLLSPAFIFFFYAFFIISTKAIIIQVPHLENWREITGEINFMFPWMKEIKDSFQILLFCCLLIKNFQKFRGEWPSRLRRCELETGNQFQALLWLY